MLCFGNNHFDYTNNEVISLIIGEGREEAETLENGFNVAVVWFRIGLSTFIREPV